MADIQERQVLQKCWSALHDHKKASQIKNAKVAAADQEYTYWLGKRIVFALRQHREQRLAGRQLTSQLVSNHEAQTKRQVYRALRLYTSFVRDRRMTDQALVDKIHATKKLRVLKQWAHCYSRRVSLRLLGQSLRNSQTRLSFDQMRRVQLIEDATVQIFRGRYPERLMRSTLRGWRNQARSQIHRRDVHGYLVQKRTQQVFALWFQRYQEEVQKVAFFNKTYIAIKNEIAGRAMKALKTNLRRKQMKKESVQHRISSLKRKALRGLAERVERRRLSQR